MPQIELIFDLDKYDIDPDRMLEALDLARQLVEEEGSYIQDTWYKALNGDILPGLAKGVYDPIYANIVADKRSIQQADPLEIVIEPYDQTHAHHVEVGYPPFDMKPKMLRSPKAQFTKKGDKYIVVPFSHNIVDDINEPPQTKSPFTISLRSKFFGVQSPQTAAYTWTRGKYQGLTKNQQTFRTISTKSDPNSWIHPGRDGAEVTRAVGAVVQDHFEARLEEEMRKFRA